MFARQRQTWKLREHHLIRSPSTSSSSEPLPIGPPLKAFFPSMTLKEDKDGLDVTAPDGVVYRYTRYKPGMKNIDSIDCILTGEASPLSFLFNRCII
jgi:hypothetical protein